MMRELVFCCLIAVALSASKDTCDYNGKIYKKGDRFMDDCNSCFCGGNDMVGCTRMLCRPRHKEPILPLKGDKDTCDYNGKLYKKGDRFMDDCNRCFCGGNDMVGCTKMSCRPRHDGNLMHDDTAEDSETCTFNGKVYQKGESFKKECNTCFCGGGNVIGCTLKMCQVKKPATSYESTTCTHKGKTFHLGEHFMDECNKCFCGVNGHVGCTQMMCIPPKDLPYAESETCTKDGKVYKKGDNFSLDGCNMCFCGGNNMIGCTKKLCPPKDAYGACKFRGRTFSKGETFKEGCVICTCTRDMSFDCDITDCQKMGNGPNNKRRFCRFQGEVYREGETFKDGCKTCQCTARNAVACTSVSCSKPGKSPGTCKRNGKIYKVLDVFTLNGCNVCTCQKQDVIMCILRVCPPYGCYFSGSFYKLGDHFTSRCLKCTCTINGSLCTKTVC